MAPFFPDAMTIRATIPEFSYNDVQILLRIILLPFSSVYLRSLNVLEKSRLGCRRQAPASNIDNKHDQKYNEHHFTESNDVTRAYII